MRKGVNIAPSGTPVVCEILAPNGHKLELFEYEKYSSRRKLLVTSPTSRQQAAIKMFMKRELKNNK